MAKILFLSANLPTNQGYLRVDKEYRIIEEKLRSAMYRDHLALVSVPASRPKDWLDQLNLHSPDVVHFSGHGSPGGKLFQLGEDDDAQPVSLQALKAVFHSIKGTARLLILNACYSRQEAEHLTEEVDCVVAMKGKIHDTAALAFTEAFYQALGYGRSVQDAFTQARAAIQLEMLDKDADVPELLVRTGVKASGIVPVQLIQQKAQDSIGLFYVHTPVPEDIDFCKELDKQFSILKRNGQIKSFYDYDILGGDDIKEIARQEMEAAQIILLIVTPDLLYAEELIAEQLEPAWDLYKKGTRVIPIMVKNTIGWTETNFKDLRALPRDGKPVYNPKKRNESFYLIAVEIKRVIESLKKQRKFT